MKKLVLFLFISLLGMTIHAKDKRRSTKKETVNFEDEVIKGSISKPDIIGISRSKDIEYGSWLKLRENFLPEMRATGELIRQGR